MTNLPPTLPPFESRERPRLVFGPDTVERAGDLAIELGARRILLVTDPGLVAAGHASRVEAILRRAGAHVTLFAEVHENPTTSCVSRCQEAARQAEVDTLIGLGGGSAMDTAKGCNFLLTNGGRMQDYWGVGKAAHPMLPLIAIPTTAGTGSECQSAALITDEQTHQKMACLDPKAAARIALLDPLLTLSQPARVTAVTGIDALAHAVESAVTTKRNPFSQMFSQRAFTLLHSGFPRVLDNPNDLEARALMQLGAAVSGLAIEHSMLGAAHAAANPLTARFGIIHGQAVGLMLPEVVRCNRQEPAAQSVYGQLAMAAGLANGAQPDPVAQADALADWLEQIRARAELPARLSDCGVAASDLPQLATEAARQWTAQFNPRKMAPQDFAELYARIL